MNLTNKRTINKLCSNNRSKLKHYIVATNHHNEI